MTGQKGAIVMGLLALTTASALAAPGELRDPPRLPTSPSEPAVTAPVTDSTTRRPGLRTRPKRSRRRREPGIPPHRPTRPAAEEAAEIEQIAPAEEEGGAEPAPEQVASVAPKPVQFEFHGFLMARATAVLRDLDAAFYGIIPAPDGPRAFFEVDLQPSLRVAGRRLHVAADVTLYISSTDPKYLLLLNELYVESQVVGPLYVAAGRKRVVWGSGLAANPTDLINPIKNPLDFEQQRAGAFLLPLVEVVTKWVTWSALVTPATTYNQHALPSAMDFTRPIFASRLYFLLKGIDVNLIYLYDHRHQKHAGGLSLSRYFGDKLEAHLETLVGQGPSGLPPVPLVPSCGVPSPAIDSVYASLVAGGRLDLADQTFLSFEYLFNGSGFSKDGYDQYRIAAPCTRAALARLPPPELEQVGHPIDPIFFLMRQHYLAVSFLRPHLTRERLEALSLGVNAIWSVVDFSLLLQARLAYKIFEQGTVGILGAAWVGPRMGEFFSSPSRAVGQIDLRVSY